MHEDHELLEVVDAEGRVLRLEKRGRIHGNPSLAHRAVHVFVRSSEGGIYLQKRAHTKRVQPGKWDTSVGGHVNPGESYQQAASRELAEELGVRLEDLGGPSSLEHLHDYVWRSAIETEHVRTYRLVCDGPFRLEPAEIEAGRFWSDEELRQPPQDQSVVVQHDNGRAFVRLDLPPAGMVILA